MKAITDIECGIELYKEKMLHDKTFVAEEFIQLLEPYFIRHGYRTQMSEQPKNILIIHDAGVGDFINLSPCLRAIRQHYPAAHIVLVLFPRALALAEACPYVDEVIANPRLCHWDNFLSLYEWNQSFFAKLLPYHFDLAFVFPHYGSAVMLAYLSGAKIRVAYDSSRVKKSSFWAGIIPYEAVVPFINQPVVYHRENTRAAERYMGVLEGFWQEKIVARGLEAWCLPEDVNKAERILADWCNYPVYTIVMGGQAPRKRWPPEKYAQLVRLLQQDYPELRFVLLGGGATDEQEAQRFMDVYGELQGNMAQVRNLVGQLTYSEAAAVMNKCEAYIGNDTGNMHLAAALDMPVLSPNCYPAEFPLGPDAVPVIFAPWQVPAVFVLPVKALDDCREKHSTYGCCHEGEVHCIGQIEVQTMRRGFDLLREQCSRDERRLLCVNHNTFL